MLHLDYLDSLRHHHNSLSQILACPDIWIVGGCVRDVLLGLTQEPHDIDLTG